LYFTASILVACSDVASGCDCPCKDCGPGGTPCEYCEIREYLCTNLLNQLQEFKKKIQKCACGIPEWMI
ncbi:hypothetical protein KR067_000834, partial [Drosophila pandora]